jgi:alpha-L-fucosidase
MKTTLSLLLTGVLAAACSYGAGGEEPLTPAPPDDERMAWWREARFGLFIHWGLYAIPAGEWEGQTNHAEWIRTTAQIPIGVYDRFIEEFNPVEFDADAWARMAKDAGMKYIVITSKHHDGFCLFDSEHTEFDVMSTPFGRDIMAELAEACRRHGLRMCWYHSIMDWHHPDYLPRRGWERDQRTADGADFDRYTGYLHGQVTELLTNYGDIGVMWFDGEWEHTWNHEYGGPLYDLCRTIQPSVIVNNRVDKGRGGMGGLTEDGKYAGDFGTPEQQIPTTGLPGVDWETCMTMNRHWGWNARDDDWKSTTDLIRKLVDIASKGGNFLLNVGPKPNGTFPEASVVRLREMGDWMDTHGESIYGTTASPFDDLEWGRCTVKREDDSSTLYLHVFDWPRDGALEIANLGSSPRTARLLGTGEALEVRSGEGIVRVSLPAEATDAHCSVVALEVEGPLVVYRAPRIVATSPIFVRPLEIEIEPGSEGLVVRYTTDGSPPTASSPVYERPIPVSETTTIAARAFHEDRAVTEVVERTIERAEPRHGLNLFAAAPGLHYRLYEGTWDVLPDFDALEPADAWFGQDVAVRPGPNAEHYGMVVRGYVTVPRDDVYAFALTSDDGSRLLVHDRLVVDNDGLHGTATERGVIALGEGIHPIRIEYFNKTGDSALELELAPLGEAMQPIPHTAFLRDPAREP